MSGTLLFREATRADLPAIIALHEADTLGGHGDAWTPENQPAYEVAFEKLLSDPREAIWVAERDGHVVGSMIATTLIELTGRGKPHVLFRSIQVSAQHRSQGIGAAMMAFAETEAKRHGMVVAELTSSSKRKDAHRFYARLGYLQSHLGFKKKL